MSNPIVADVDRFIELAVCSGLANREQLQDARAVSCAPSENAATAIDNLCEALVANGLFTRWQCDKLRNGQYKGFFFEQRYKLVDRLGIVGGNVAYHAFDLVNKRMVTLRIGPPDDFGKHRYDVEPRQASSSGRGLTGSILALPARLAFGMRRALCSLPSTTRPVSRRFGMTLCANCQKLLLASATACPYCGADAAESRRREQRMYVFAGVGAGIGAAVGIAVWLLSATKFPAVVLYGIGVGIGTGLGAGLGGMRKPRAPN